MVRLYKNMTPRLVNLLTPNKRRLAVLRKNKRNEYRPTVQGVYLTMLLRTSNGWMRNRPFISNKKLVPLQKSGLMKYVRIPCSNNQWTLTLTEKGTYLRKLFTMMYGRMDTNTEFELTQTSFNEEVHAKAYQENEKIAEASLKYLALANESLMEIKCGDTNLGSFIDRGLNLQIKGWSLLSKTKSPLFTDFACARLETHKALEKFAGNNRVLDLIHEFAGVQKGTLLKLQRGPRIEDWTTYFINLNCSKTKN